jgi:hypothetical protein
VREDSNASIFRSGLYDFFFVLFVCFIVLSVQAAVFWVLTLCNLVGGYQNLEGQATSDATFFVQSYMMSQPRRPQIEN